MHIIPKNREGFNSFQFIFLLLTLYGYELISFFPSFYGLTESRPVTVAFRIFLFLLTLIVILKNKIRIQKWHLLIFLFWFFYLLRLFHDTALSDRVINSPLIEYWSFSAIIILTILACTSYFSATTLLSVRKYVLIFLFIINVLGFYNVMTNPLDVPDGVLVRADANPSLNTIAFGRTAAVLIFICLVYLLQYKTKTWVKVFLLIAMLLGIFNIFTAGSRGPLLQLCITVLIYFFTNRNLIKMRSLIALCMIFIILAFLFPNYLDVTALLFDRLQETGFSSNNSDRIRASFFNSAWNQFLDNPLLGDSIETIVGGTYPHNLILESLMALGLFGGILMTVLFIKSFKTAIGYMKYPHLNWIGAILLMQSVSSLSTSSITTHLLFWPLFAMTININGRVQHNKQNQ